ncbi:hypothetical protein ACFX19_044251 [Malus domestica]
MAQENVEELAVQLERALELWSMEQGVKLVGSVNDNMYIIFVRDEDMADYILKQVPLNLGIKENVRKPCEGAGEFLELEDISLARGFLRVIILVHTTILLAKGCCPDGTKYMGERTATIHGPTAGGPLGGYEEWICCLENVALYEGEE